MAEDKKQALKAAAHDIFSKKGYKATGVSEIVKQAGVAVGSFYNYYDSKDSIFLDVYIDENNRVRKQMMERIDWTGDVVQMINQIFSQSRQLIAANKILSNWENSAISERLQSYYQSEKGQEENLFHHFLLETFTRRMLEEGFTSSKIQEVLQVYSLLYYMDTHINNREFPNYSETVDILTKYFVQGLFE